MNINSRISRGMERLLAQREGARLEGLFGLSGLGSVDTFSGLADVLTETGFADARGHVNNLRRTHGAMCSRIRAALPVAVDAARLMQASGGDLAGIFSKLKKLAPKLSLSHQILKKVAPKAIALSPSQILLTAAGAKKAKATPAQAAARAQAKADKKAAKAAAKAAKKAAKAAAALAKANAANMTPAQAGAAVLANESGVPLLSPGAQQFAQDLVSSGSGGGGGGGGPVAAESSSAPDGAADDGLIFGMTPLMAGGAALALAGGAYLLLRRRRN